MKVLREEVIPQEPIELNGLYGYYEVEIWGMLGKMKGADEVLAIFGGFKRTDRKTLLYTASVWTRNGSIDHPYEDEFLDDLIALRDDRCSPV